MYIHNRISKLRRKSKLKLDFLSRGIVSTSHLSNIESGRYYPSTDILELLAHKLGVPKNYLTESDKADEKLVHLLNEFELSIFTKLNACFSICSEIKNSYPYINHIDSEIKFFILESCYLLKEGLVSEAQTVYNNEFLPFKNQEMPKNIIRLEYYFLGGLAYYQEDYRKSLNYYQQLLPLYKNRAIQGVVHYNIGLVLFKLMEPKKGLLHLRQAVEQYIMDKKWNELGETYNLFGTIYLQENEPELAEKYLELSLSVAQEHSFTSLIAKVLHNLAISNKNKNNREKAKKLFLQSIDLKSEIKDQNIIISYFSLIEMLTKEGNMELALKYITDVEKYVEVDTITQYKLFIFKGRVVSKIASIDKGIPYYEKAMHFFEKKKLWKYIVTYSEEYGDLLFQNRKYKKAAEVYKFKFLSERMLL